MVNMLARHSLLSYICEKKYNSLQMMFSLSLITYMGSYYFMAYMAKSTYGSNGNLIDAGIDLNMEQGMAEYVVIHIDLMICWNNQQL